VAPLDDPAAESSSIGWDVRCAAASSSAPADGAAVGWDACIDVGSCVTDDAAHPCLTHELNALARTIQARLALLAPV